MLNYTDYSDYTNSDYNSYTNYIDCTTMISHSDYFILFIYVFIYLGASGLA